MPRSSNFLPDRYLVPAVRNDLVRKMVFVAGPRQVGKTTLARNLPGGVEANLNWDVGEDRDRILRHELPAGDLWVFDEIHKYRSWRGFLKGVFDSRPSAQRILVTGSAKLDFYRHGGDSLQGRYHLLWLHPFSIAELGLQGNEALGDLLLLGGFPEPYLSASEIQARRWSREYRQRLVHEDVSDLERVVDLGNLELLTTRLPDLVGSPLSVNALREDLQVSHKAVSHWLDILERLYSIFRLAPFGAPRIRAVKKERKHYHLDWSIVPSEGARFENLVAVHLLKWVHYQQDVFGKELDLRYFRDTDGREVDFVVTDRLQPLLLVECKWSDADVDRGLRDLKARFPSAHAWQLSAVDAKDYQTPEGIRVAPAVRLFRDLV